MNSLIQDQLSNKNVSSIIIEYLTDPPPLPFIDELYKQTSDIFVDTVEFWFTNTRFSYINNINNRSYQSGSFKIGHMSKYYNWYLRIKL